ncbi:hypothetical protein ACOSQ3_031733 [Xanthoceras sorbifolium]
MSALLLVLESSLAPSLSLVLCRNLKFHCLKNDFTPEISPVNTEIPLVTRPTKKPEVIAYTRQRKSHQLVEEQTHPVETEVSEQNQVSETVPSSQEEVISDNLPIALK